MKDIMYSKRYSEYFEYYKKGILGKSRWARLRYSFALKLCGRYFTYKYPVLASKQKVFGLNTTEKRDEKIIVSLTSFPKRINKVWICISTILRQSVKPDVVELWLSKEQFPNEEKDLPENLLELKEQGLSIFFCEDDLRSHKKYFYSMQKHPNDIVITCDDDFFYPSDMIFSLYEEYKKTGSIVGTANTFIGKENFYSPIQWKMCTSETQNADNLGLYSGSATLFPPHTISGYGFDLSIIKKTCPYADDLWLTAMTYLNGKKVSSLGRLPFPLPVKGTQEEALTKTNNSESSAVNNDTQWKTILDYFSEELKEWKESLLNG